MRVLAFDTATTATAVALVDDRAGLRLEARDDPPVDTRPNHTSRLLALIEDVLARSGDGWGPVDRLAVGAGPGTFTGLRIGVATAHALARARDIPLVGVSTLASLALAAAAGGRGRNRPVAAVIDARRGEVFAAAWGPAADPATEPPQLTPAALPPHELGERMPAGLAVGDGAVRFRAILERAGLEVPADDSELHRVSAVWHCRLALTATPGTGDSVQPSYLRRPDAERSLTA